MVQTSNHLGVPNLPLPEYIQLGNVYAVNSTLSDSTMSRSSSFSSLSVGNSPEINCTLDQFSLRNVDEGIVNFITPRYTGFQPYSAFTDTLAQFSPRDTSAPALNTQDNILLVPRLRVQTSNLTEESLVEASSTSGSAPDSPMSDCSDWSMNYMEICDYISLLKLDSVDPLYMQVLNGFV